MKFQMTKKYGLVVELELADLHERQLRHSVQVLRKLTEKYCLIDTLYYEGYIDDIFIRDMFRHSLSKSTKLCPHISL